MIRSSIRVHYFLLVLFAASTLPACEGSTPGGGNTTITMQGDTTPPSISSTSPAPNATGVPTNSSLTVTFTEPVNPATVTPGNISLNASTGAVTGVLQVSGSTITFTPSPSLSFMTTYTLTITTAIKDFAGNTLVTPSSWSFTTGPAADTTPPIISATTPTTNASGVSINASVEAIFGEDIDQNTISTSTFLLSQGGVPVTGTVSALGATASFHADTALAYSTAYTATLTAGIKDLAGNPLATDYAWSFTTGTAPDTTLPSVSATTPVPNAANVSISSALTVTFSEDVDHTTISTVTFTLSNGTNPVAGTVSINGMTAVFTPLTFLAYGTPYTATLTADIKDLAGNALAAPHSWSFTTGAAPDATAPSVLSTTPSNGDTGVAITSDITASFSEAMDPGTINATTMGLSVGGAPVAGTVTYSGTMPRFTPAVPMMNGTAYTATITTGARDLSGNPLITPVSWTFSTLASNAPPSFNVITVDPSSPNNPYAKNLADLNNDGLPDIIVIGRDGPINWYAAPGWTKSTIANANSGFFTQSGSAVGDIDGDGDTDITVGTDWLENPLPGGSPSGLWIRHPIGPGFGSGTGNHDVSLGDLDQDGKPDVVMRGENAGEFTIRIYKQNSPTNWTSRDIEPGLGRNGLAIADLNGDSQPDIIVGGVWMQNPGTIAGAWIAHSFANWDDFAAVAAADMNNDGRLDVVLSVSENTGPIAWFENPPITTTSNWTEHLIDAGPLNKVHSIGLADMNNDGTIDVVATEFGDPGLGRVLVYYNGANGQTWVRQMVASGRYLQNSRVADIGNDGDFDIMGSPVFGTVPIEIWEHK